MKKNPIFSMNGGEVSPLIQGRSDLPKYRAFQKTLNNFIVEPQGAIKRRLGTEIQARLGASDELEDSIIEPWLVDRVSHFQMLFVRSEIRFFNQNGIRVFTLSIPYSQADFDKLYFRQVYDIMYICHPDYPVKILTRTEQFVWVIQDAVFNGGPYSDDNQDSASTVSVALGVDPEVTVTAVDDLFVDSDVGRTFRIIHPEAISAKGAFNSDTSSVGFAASGQSVTLTTKQSWSGTLTLELSLDGGDTWTPLGTISSVNDSFNGTITRDIENFGALVRVNYDADNASTMAWTLDIVGTFYDNYIITSVTSAKIAVMDLVDGFHAVITDSWQWSIGAFSETTGYPTCVEIYNERLFLAGVASYPSDIYVSQTNSFTSPVNFLSGVLSNSPFRFTLLSDIRNRVLWFVADQQLIVGTDNSEFTISSRNSNAGIAIDNINVSRQTEYGSDPIQPIRGDDTSYFVEIGGRRVRSLNYVFDRDSYISDDMSILAPHLTETAKIVKFAFTRTPDKIIWALLDDGTLLTFTTEKEQNVGAWSKHPLLKNTNTNINEEWDTEVIGTVVDINSVLTDDGDILGLVIRRQEGVYFETLSPTNDCIDAQTVFEGIQETDVLALPGAEDFTYWNQSFVEMTVPYKGLGSFLRLDIPVSDLIIKYDGVALTIGSPVLAQVREDLLYWIPLGSDETLITVFDGLIVVSPANYYTVNAPDCLIVQVKPLQPISSFVILDNGTPLVKDLEYFAMVGDIQFLIIDPPNMNPETVTLDVAFVVDSPLENDDNNPVLSPINDSIFIDTSGSVDALAQDQFEVFVPIVLISIFTKPTATAYFGLKILSLAEMVDMYNSPSYDGGLGGTRRDVEADVYVYNSVNIDYTSNAGLAENTRWQRVLFIDQEPVMGEKIPLFTGKKKIKTLNGYSDQANVGIRSDSPYCLAITQIGPSGSKLSSRSSK